MGRPKAVRTEKPLKSASSDKKSRGKRYSDAEKAKILEHALAEMKVGGQITKIADKLGVTFFTLKTWLKESGSAKESGGAIAQKRGRGRPKGSLKKATAAAAPVAAAVVWVVLCELLSLLPLSPLCSCAGLSCRMDPGKPSG